MTLPGTRKRFPAVVQDIGGMYFNAGHPEWGIDFAGVADAGPAINNIINEADGRWIYMPSGIIKCSTTILRSVATLKGGLKIIGDGKRKTVFRHAVASGPLFKLDITTLLGFQLGVRLKDFTIEPTGTAGAVGIEMTGCKGFQIKRIEMKPGLTSHGVNMPYRTDLATNPDGWANFFGLWEDVEINGCDGWGFYQPSDLGYNSSEHVNCYIVNNKQGGYSLSGSALRTRGGAIGANAYLNSAGGGYVTNFVATVPQNHVLEQIEVDGNRYKNILLNELIGGKVEQCRLIGQDDLADGAMYPQSMIHFGGALGGPNVTEVDVIRCHVRSDTTQNYAVTAFNFAAATEADRIRIRDTTYGSNSSALTKYAGITGSHSIEITETGKILNVMRAEVYVQAAISAAQNLATASAAVTFDSEERDSHSAYVPAAGGTNGFTCPYTGTFRFDGVIQVQGLVAGNTVQISLFVNDAVSGTYTIRIANFIAKGGTESFPFCFTTAQNKNDRLQIFGFQGSGAARVITTGFAQSWLTISGQQ